MVNIIGIYSAKNTIYCIRFNPILSFIYSSFCELILFQGLLKNVPWTSRACSRYLKGLPNLFVFVSKKMANAQHTNQIICQCK